MEKSLRDLFESALAEALESDDPHECIVKHFASHSTRRRRGGRPARKGVDIEQRKADLTAFLSKMCVKDESCSILLEDVQTRFNEARRRNREPRVAWNEQLLAAIDGLYGNKIFGMRWVMETDE